MFKKDRAILFLLSLFISCNLNTRPIQRQIVSSKFILQNFTDYELIRKNAIDSINSWVKDSLSVVKPYFFCDPWMVDSIFLFNKDSSRLFSVTINADTLNKDAVMDYIQYFGGAKIEGKWYFFIMGTTLALPREQYKYNIYESLTFMQMSYLAHQEILSAGIRRLENGQYVTDEAFMERQFFDRDYIDKYYGGDRNNLDTMVLNSISGKYKYKLDTAEIAKIKKEMAESRRPYLPPQSWWDKTFNRKLFDE